MDTNTDNEEGDLQLIISDDGESDIPENYSEAASQCGKPIHVDSMDEAESEYFTLMECRDAYEEEAKGIEALYGDEAAVTGDWEDYLLWIESLIDVDDSLAFID